MTKRARELGIIVGSRPTGALNAITDLAGVRVGHTTLIEGDSIRTGVTAIVPDQLDERRSLPAGLFVGNGHGKMVGSTQLVELGEIETPVLLTATLSTFRVADALLTYMLGRPGREAVQSLNPVVAETNDGFLSDIRARPISTGHVLAALEQASGGLPAEGTVGAGTGTGALGFKGGIGTASRVVSGAGVGRGGTAQLVVHGGDNNRIPRPHEVRDPRGPGPRTCTGIAVTVFRMAVRRLRVGGGGAPRCRSALGRGDTGV
jgi:D-aminopeptidase